MIYTTLKARLLRNAPIKFPPVRTTCKPDLAIVSPEQTHDLAG